MRKMKSFFRCLALSLVVNTGINPKKAFLSICGFPSYFRILRMLKRQRKISGGDFDFALPFPCLSERFSDSGTARGHYFHQDLLVSRRIFQNNPKRHVDVGSRIDGFVAHVASFREIEVIDIRPLNSTIANICFKQVDFMEPLPKELHEYSDSLSCLHALEHFGLGRYGDPADYNGHLRGLDNLRLTLKTGGKLYFSVPIGPQRIEYNAHRVFSICWLLKQFDGKYSVDSFSFVDDKGNLHEKVSLDATAVRNNFGCNFGCGIFELTKL